MQALADEMAQVVRGGTMPSSPESQDPDDAEEAARQERDRDELEAIAEHDHHAMAHRPGQDPRAYGYNDSVVTDDFGEEMENDAPIFESMIAELEDIRDRQRPAGAEASRVYGDVSDAYESIAVDGAGFIDSNARSYTSDLARCL